MSEYIFEAYFKRNQRGISDLLRIIKQQGMKVALWGAGMRGRAFLHVFDPECNNIDYVYDLNKEKYDTSLPTGHFVVDYRTYEAGIILLSNCAYEEETLRFMKEIEREVRVINLDNMVLGMLSAEEVLNPVPLDLTPVRHQGVCAMVIAYHPDDSVFENISTYLDDVDHFYFYDNTEDPSDAIKKKVEKLPKTDYIAHGENLGLGVPINEVAEIASDYDWIITFDQDSQAAPGMIEKMRRFSECGSCDERVGIIAPVIDEYVHDGIINDKSRYFDYIYFTYQSGTMINRKAMNDIGGYWGELFIDFVDTEYCYRNLVNQYKLIRINSAQLIHQVGRKEKEIIVDGREVVPHKYSPQRYFYRMRNSLLISEKYKESFPVGALEMGQVDLYLNTMLKVDDNKEEKKEAMEQGRKAYQEMKEELSLYGKR